MRITKKIEAEIKNVMNDYWGSYLSGEIEKWANYLVDDYRNIGSTDVEIWNSKQEIFDYTLTILDQMVGYTELRNKKTEIIPYDPYVMVHEYLDIYIKIDDKWKFYSKLRLSSLIQKIKNKWKILHQHGSYPDSNVMDGEFFAFDKLKSENIKLQEAVKSRTEELEIINRELEIEAALERVRTVAMSMNTSDDLLSICEVTFGELKKLGFENIRNAVIHIPNDEQKYFMDYDYSDFTGGQIGKVDYGLHPIVDDYLEKIRSAEDAFYEVVIKEDMLEGWNEFRKASGQMYDKRIEKANALYYYLFSIGIGDIGISTFKPINESQIRILKRFRNVFDLAYRRYNDITLAEAQAREAQIEAALERVRSRSIGMQKSEELKEVIRVVYEQFVQLNVNVDHAGFVVDYIPKGDWHFWIADQNEIPSKITHPYFDSVWAHQFNEAKEKGMEYFATNLDFEEKNKFYTELLSYLPGLPEESIDFYLNCPGLAGLTVLFDNVSLYIENFSCTPYTDEENKILMRFGKVFQQTYTRFLDLQKAEAQAREAQIEAALERVRARSMAMHNSHELVEASDVMFDQMKKLGIEILRIGIGTINEKDKTVEIWSRSEIKGKVENKIVGVVPFGVHPVFDGMVKAWREKKPYFASERVGNEVKDYYKRLSKYLSYPLPKIYNKRESVTTFFFKAGSLNVISLLPLKQEECDIMIRFAKVFNQTYTRFLDLQKAEAQAREAQVETALEKIRSRTMAMQSSDELPEAANLLFLEVRALGIPTWSAGYNILSTDKKTAECWMSSEGAIQPSFTLYFKKEKSLIEQHKFFKSDRKFMVQELSGKALEKHYDYMKAIPKIGDIIKGLEKSGISLPTRQINHLCKFEQGYLLFITYEPVPEAHELFIRFTKVFEQTYTRFLDLQKAEAQAREAQIEAALERIRSRAMGMQKSEEVGDVSDILFSEFNKLNLEVSGCSIIVIDEEEDKMELWRARSNVAVKPFERSSFNKSMKISKKHMPAFYKKFFNALEKRENYLIVKFEGAKYLKYINVISELYNYSKAEKAKILKNVPDKIIAHYIFTKLGYLALTSEKELSEENLSIAKRFIESFDFAYTRFLDIQKTEAQAREAEIQLALERVRSRSMAMHKSEELADLSLVLVKQVQALGVATWFCAFNIYDDDPEGSLEWGSNGEGTFPQYRTPREGIFLRYYEAGERGETLLVNEIGEDECPSHYDYLCTLPGVGEQLLKMKDSGIPFPTSQIDHVAYFKYGYIIFITYEPVEESHDIFKRFAKVFQQTYTRFLDLKKSEAQAREAEIQLALERVRAKTMAMQKSNELAQTAANLFEQMETLGIRPYRCNIAIVDSENKQIKLWSTTNNGNVIPVSSDIPLNENNVFNEIYNGWKKQKKHHTIKLIGENRVNWTKYISKYVPLEEYKPKNFNKSKLMKEAAYFNNFYFRQGFFVIHTKEEISDEDFGIIQRFANVFEQTYTRFRDLENAEYQNKIIQAENERKTEELEEARQLQLSMLPKDLPKLPNLDIAVYMQTATEVGGDYYDFHVGDDGELTAVIGDATGHGLKAGTVVTITKSLFNNLASEKDVLNSFSKISQVIKDMNFPQLSMCLQMLKIRGNKLVLSSAAMPPVLIYRKNKKTVEEVEINGMPLGAMLNFPYKTQESKLDKGDTIFMMSDGYPELMNKNKMMFGYRRVKNIFHSIAEKSPKAIISSLKKSASEWANGNAPDDDVTFVVIKVK